MLEQNYAWRIMYYANGDPRFGFDGRTKYFIEGPDISYSGDFQDEALKILQELIDSGKNVINQVPPNKKIYKNLGKYLGGLE